MLFSSLILLGLGVRPNALGHIRKGLAMLFLSIAERFW